MFNVEVIALRLAHMRAGIEFGMRVKELAENLEVLSYKEYNPDQPRDDHGRWTNGGGNTDILIGGSGNDTIGSGNKLDTMYQSLDEATQKRAQAIYGETSGLTPVLINPNGNPYNSNNWNPNSTEQLNTAKTYIGIVSDRNSYVNYALPSDTNNPIEAAAWASSLNSAINGSDGSQLDSRVTNFFIRQDGVGTQAPNWPNLQLHMSLGPFNNVGGGDVPKGPNTYIDFYGKKK